MHAYLYIGSNTIDRNAAIDNDIQTRTISSFDRIELTVPEDKSSIGVSDTRSFMKQLSLSPQGDAVAGIIRDAGLLTTEAQQALLKTIEEPPPHVLLFIGAASETIILPTIVSRCQKLLITTQETVDYSTCEQLLNELAISTPGKKISLIATIGKTRDDAKRWIDTAIVASWKLQRNPSRVHALLDAKRLAANNVNPFQLLEHIFLT